MNEIRKDKIAGTVGREPVGVVLSCGIKKGGSGFPVDKDRYHLVNPREDSGMRPYHPAFASFNSAPSEKRRVIRGNIVHATRAGCHEGYLKHQVDKRTGAHPNRAPFCTGDGVHAIRWMGGEADNFLDIKCPNDKCEYRLCSPTLCKPFTRLLFRLRWADGVKLPSMLCKYTSGSWNTYLNVLGFFEDIDRTAREMGLENYSLFGYPFTLTLTQQTKPSERTRFPVSVITPEEDPVTFFARQSEQLKLARGTSYEALPDLSQQSADVIYDDVQSVSVPGSK